MFFLIPAGVDYRARRYPMITFSLIGINTLIWLATLIASLQTHGQSNDWIQDHFWLKPSDSTWYTYLTSLFVHEGFLHLLGNMIYLFLFGSCVEDIIGRWQFVLFYLLGGVAGDFSHIAVTPEHFASTIPLGGASGAISACIGGFLLLLHRTKIEFRWLVWIIVRVYTGVFWLPAWLVISFYFVKDAFSVVVSLMDKGSGGGVAFGAHVGGLLSGLAMIGIYKGYRKWRPPRIEDDEDEIAVEPVGLSQEPATIFLCEGTTQSGPFTSAQIGQMLTIGAISSEALYWEEGMDDWRTVAELPVRQ
jgi:membrane associated rhomboid family serine protease